MRRARCSSSRGIQWICGTSIDWVGRLVETLSGKNLEEYFRERIFAPLEMSDTFYNVPDTEQARLVTVYRRQDGRADAPLTEQPSQPQRPATTFNGGGGLTSTASDYIRFARMVLNGGTSWGGITNTYFRLDPARGIAGVAMMQLLPFAGIKALAIYGTFERGVYQLAVPSRDPGSSPSHLPHTDRLP